MALDKGQVIACEVLRGGVLRPLHGGERFATVRLAQAYVRSDGAKVVEEREDEDVQIVIVEIRSVARLVVRKTRAIVFDDTAVAEAPTSAEAGEA